MTEKKRVPKRRPVKEPVRYQPVIWDSRGAWCGKTHADPRAAARELAEMLEGQVDVVTAAAVVSV